MPFYSLVESFLYCLTAQEVDSLAQQVEHIPFKDGVLGSSPRRITETARRSKALSLVFLYIPYFYRQKHLSQNNTLLYFSATLRHRTNSSKESQQQPSSTFHTREPCRQHNTNSREEHKTRFHKANKRHRNRTITIIPTPQKGSLQRPKNKKYFHTKNNT